jgi:hypothetical protein
MSRNLFHRVFKIFITSAFLASSFPPAHAGPSCPNGGDIAILMRCLPTEPQASRVQSISILNRSFDDAIVKDYEILVVEADGETSVKEYPSQGPAWIPGSGPFQLNFGKNSNVATSNWQFVVNSWCPTVYKGSGTLTVGGIKTSLKCESYVHH